ncbi:GPI mannosyltransferase 1-like [Dysidea avara]|uniref:GPI mannosyltransferase 1-like n=1 Tax=Dysidea avara TaxID=196820 RepID=UPI00331A8F8E
MPDNLLYGWITAKRLIAFSFLFRVALMFYGEVQDRYLDVKYTDIDYHVFSDGARHFTEGNSPFLRETYRYTPLLAILLSPNIFLFYSFGKVIFVICDVLCGILIREILLLRGINGTLSLFCSAIWLLNPVTATVSSRGNAEPLITGLILLTIYLLLTKRTVLSAISYGLAVHMKMYPVIYALPLYLFLNNDYSEKVIVISTPTRSGFVSAPSMHGKIFGWQVEELFSKDRKVFTVTSFLTFAMTTAVMYVFYGNEFLQEAYLYHFTRTDIKHNFSVYFYMLYVTSESLLSRLISLMAFLPQLLLVVVTAIILHQDITLCLFVQTCVFVTFNKVCTSQYFLWYLVLLPLVVPYSKLNIHQAFVLTSSWFIGQALWLAPAYYLEFQGYDTYVLIWLAGLVFFCISCFIVSSILRHHDFVATFSNGHINRSYTTNTATVSFR